MLHICSVLVKCAYYSKLNQQSKSSPASLPPKLVMSVPAAVGGREKDRTSKSHALTIIPATQRPSLMSQRQLTSVETNRRLNVIVST